MKILVTGATGYVGSRLVPRLLKGGHEVRVTSSRPTGPRPWWSDRVESVTMNALDAEAVHAAVEGTDAVYYLIHGMGGDDFLTRDRKAASHMAHAINTHGVDRVIYLSGIVPDVPEDELSDHIFSRLEVEDRLAASRATSVVLRAAVLLGSGSTSFEIVRQISERMPIHTVPTWMDSKVQPIAIVDALEALVSALTITTVSRHYDLGGPTSLKYAELLQAYAQIASIERSQIHVPAVPERLVQELVGRIVDVPAGVVHALIKSLHHDMVSADEDFRELLPRGYELLAVEESIRRSLVPVPADPPTADPMGPLPHDPDWAHGGFGHEKDPGGGARRSCLESGS